MADRAYGHENLDAFNAAIEEATPVLHYGIPVTREKAARDRAELEAAREQIEQQVVDREVTDRVLDERLAALRDKGNQPGGRPDNRPQK